MARPSRSKLAPWIEQLIRNYGGEEGGGGRLKAHVIGVGQMTPSQAQGCDGPSGLLFLSDGVLQIPAVLTAAAWEKLQEQEDRECFTSLVNATVCIQDYRLGFHMAPEQTRCRFFLSVGELATTAAGPVRDSTPCCTTLPSVRLKIVKTWKGLQGVEESQKSQGAGFDLSELLGEWQHDCLQAVLQDVRERVAVASRCSSSPPPSRSAFSPAPTHPDVVTATSWDVDRVRYKGAKRFSVPITCLFVPEEEAEVGGRMQRVCNAASGRRGSAVPAAAEGAYNAVDSPPHQDDSTLHQHVLAGITDDIRPLANPWDIFPPPCDTSSSSDSCREATPPLSQRRPATAPPGLDPAGILASTQRPVYSSTESQQTSEPSLFPAYQKPLDSTGLCGSLASSTSTKDHSACVGMKEKSKMQAKSMEQGAEETHGKAKRKRSEPPPRAGTTLAEEEGQVSASPPSWLFDTQAGRGASDASGHKRGRGAGSVSRKTPTVHSDGRSFSYSYQVSGQNLQDFSGFRVEESLLQWAVKMLVVPKQADNPHNMSRNKVADLGSK